MLNDPYYKVCARVNEGGCDGNITLEHAILYGGKQVNEKWAIIPLCARHHGVLKWQDHGLLNKEKNEWIALNRATDEELEALSKVKDWKHRRDMLNEKFRGEIS